VIREAASKLSVDVSVLAFPEGTTTSGRGVLPFRRGVFGAARIARAPVVPVAVSYEDPELPWVGSQLFLPHYLRTASKPVTHVHVHFFEPMEVAPGGEGRCARHARDIVRAWVAPTTQA
jgi:1-acyl-sn-glycerol-3-phosphate acyltransferase